MQGTHNFLKKFRELMTLKNIEIYVLPRTDEHQVFLVLYFRASIYVLVMSVSLLFPDLLDLMLLR